MYCFSGRLRHKAVSAYGEFSETAFASGREAYHKLADLDAQAYITKFAVISNHNFIEHFKNWQAK